MLESRKFPYLHIFLNCVHQCYAAPKVSSNLLAHVTRFAVTEEIHSLRGESVSRRVYHRNVPDRVICRPPRRMVSKGVMLEDGEPERTVLKQLMLQRNWVKRGLFPRMCEFMTKKHYKRLNNDIFIYFILNRYVYLLQ